MGKKSKILVTGGAGFIGSEVVKQLLVKGYSVTVADDLSKKEAMVPKGCRFIKTDLTDFRATEKALRGCDYCIHLAAKIGGIGYFHKYPATILSENNKLYSSVFEASVKNKIKRIVYVSSSMVFESTARFPSVESDVRKIPPPVTSYGFSKLIGEQCCVAFKEQFGLNYTICRPFNAYGINEAPGNEVGYAHVIPDLIKKILSGQYPFEMLGNGKQTRCFTHVSDIARGIIMAMESKKAENEDFNLGTEEEMRMIDLAKLIFNLCETGKKFKVKFVLGFKHDIKRRVPSGRKAKKLLGWKPEIKLKDELRNIIDWIKEDLKKNGKT